MKDVQWVDKERGCACRGEGCGDLGTDVSALADTRYNDFSLAVVDQFNGFVETVTNLWYQSYHGLSLILDALYGVFSCSHFGYFQFDNL